MIETPPPDPGRAVSLLNAARELTLANVLVIALLVLIAVPVYIIWRALGDEKIMDRLMSTYEELGDQETGCAVRHVQARGGPDQWAISSGFAFQGNDRWSVNVILHREPTPDETVAFCASLKLIADRMLDRGADQREGSSDIFGGSVPGTAPDGRRYGRDLPADRAPSTQEEK